MVVTMLIGNAVGLGAIPTSITDQSQTLSSVIANEFNEAVTKLHISALIALGATLFILSMGINIGAQLLVKRMVKVVPGGKE
jgi:phosphate transport system permease protein